MPVLELLIRKGIKRDFGVVVALALTFGALLALMVANMYVPTWFWGTIAAFIAVYAVLGTRTFLNHRNSLKAHPVGRLFLQTPNEVVWLYEKSVNGRSIGICAGTVQGKIHTIIAVDADSNHLEQLWKEVIAAAPHATQGYSPALFGKFKTNPESLRVKRPTPTLDPSQRVTSIIVQYPIEGLFGSEADNERRYHIESVLNARLEPALGDCSGSDVGSGNTNIFIDGVSSEWTLSRDSVLTILEEERQLQDATVALSWQHTEEEDKGGFVVVWPPNHQGEFNLF